MFTKKLLTVIPPMGDFQTFEVPDTLETLQSLVGGGIETVPDFRTFDLRRCVTYCNEEGKFTPSCKPNLRATCLWWAQVPDTSDVLFGTVVVVQTLRVPQHVNVREFDGEQV